MRSGSFYNRKFPFRPFLPIAPAISFPHLASPEYKTVWMKWKFSWKLFILFSSDLVASQSLSVCFFIRLDSKVYLFHLPRSCSESRKNCFLFKIILYPRIKKAKSPRAWFVYNLLSPNIMIVESRRRLEMKLLSSASKWMSSKDVKWRVKLIFHNETITKLSEKT